MSHSTNTPPSSRLTTAIPALATLAVAMGCASPAWAIDGGSVVAGTGTIQTQRNITTINQSSDRMVVNWKNFDVARNQTVNFQQPGATSAVLNRVSGSGKATEILGSVNANGRVFMVNPDGVMFGKTAKVDAGALVASALDANTTEFMAGGREYRGNAAPNATNLPRYLTLEGGQGNVRNEGRLSAREGVVLAGRQVVNVGTIRARSVELHAGQGVAVRLDDSSFHAVPTRAGLNALVENNGVINASGGNITLSAAAKGELLRDVVRNTGTMEATRAVSGPGGGIELQAPVEGSISIGGRVKAESRVMASTSPYVYATDMPMPVLDYPDQLAAKGHDIRLEQNARITATQVVNLEAQNDLAVAGRVDSGSIWLDGDNVTTLGTVHGTSNVNVSARGSLVQKGSLIADTAHVSLRAHDIEQTSDALTRAGDYISLEAARTRGGTVRASRLQGKSVSIVGNDIKLDGNVRAEGNVRVTAADERICSDTCTTELRQGSIAQNASVTSTNGDITFTGYSMVQWPDLTSRFTSGVLTQGSAASTRAGGSVKVDTSKATIGNIQAGKAIVVTARNTTLTGRLQAPEITLPSGTLNVEGNVRIKR